MDSEFSEKKSINILSFDGGGSRGVMEVMILDDFMRLATLMKPSKEETNLSIFAISLKTIINKLGDEQKKNELMDYFFAEGKLKSMNIFSLVAGIIL